MPTKSDSKAYMNMRVGNLTHNKKWTDEIIKENIIRIKNELNINWMPSRNDIANHEGNNGLSCVIGKSKKGYYGYAKELNLEIKDSETKIGKKYEYIAYEILENKGYSITQMPQNFPYDILINKTIKIDVKFSYLYKGQSGDFYSFNLEKPYCTCDIYIAITKIDEFDENTTYRIIPSKFVYSNTQIGIGVGTSKYDKYINRWDYIEQYDNFYKQIT